MRTLIAATALVLFASTAHAAQPLVEPAWLAAHLDDANVKVLDIRNKIDGGSAEAFAAGHIPGAVYSDYLAAGWRTTVDGVVGKLPPTADVEALIGGLGIANDDHVIVVHGGVNSTDFGSATRVYWTFKVMGHEEVSILDGGYKAWAAAGLPVETGAVTPTPTTFTATFTPRYLATTEQVETAAANGTPLVDARPAEQFVGNAKHGKARAPGTIPGAVNLQQQTLVAESGEAKGPSQVGELMANVGLKDDGEQIAFCNTGHWASVAWFSLSEVKGNKNVRMYDGSMVEWSADPARPLENGAAAN